MGSRNRMSIVEIQQKIQTLVKECALCGSPEWELEADLFNLRLGIPWSARNSKQIKCALLVCHNCGNTHIVDIEKLSASHARSKHVDEAVTVQRMKEEEQLDDVAYMVSEESKKESE